MILRGFLPTFQRDSESLRQFCRLHVQDALLSQQNPLNSLQPGVFASRCNPRTVAHRGSRRTARDEPPGFKPRPRNLSLSARLVWVCLRNRGCCVVGATAWMAYGCARFLLGPFCRARGRVGFVLGARCGGPFSLGRRESMTPFERETVLFADRLCRFAEGFRWTRSGSGHLQPRRVRPDGSDVPIHNQFGQPIHMSSTPRDVRRARRDFMFDLLQAGVVHDWRTSRKKRRQTRTSVRDQVQAALDGRPDLLSYVERLQEENRRFRRRAA